jgi:hypothetical protein
LELKTQTNEPKKKSNENYLENLFDSDVESDNENDGKGEKEGMSENWDKSEEKFSYDPLKNVKEKPNLLTVIQHSTPAEREDARLKKIMMLEKADDQKRSPGYSENRKRHHEESSSKNNEKRLKKDEEMRESSSVPKKDEPAPSKHSKSPDSTIYKNDYTPSSNYNDWNENERRELMEIIKNLNKQKGCRFTERPNEFKTPGNVRSRLLEMSRQSNDLSNPINRSPW